MLPSILSDLIQSLLIPSFHLTVQLQRILNNAWSQTDLWFKHSAQKLGEGGEDQAGKRKGIGALANKNKNN